MVSVTNAETGKTVQILNAPATIKNWEKLGYSVVKGTATVDKVAPKAPAGSRKKASVDNPPDDESKVEAEKVKKLRAFCKGHDISGLKKSMTSEEIAFEIQEYEFEKAEISDEDKALLDELGIKVTIA